MTFVQHCIFTIVFYLSLILAVVLHPLCCECNVSLSSVQHFTQTVTGICMNCVRVFYSNKNNYCTLSVYAMTLTFLNLFFPLRGIFGMLL